MSKKKKRNNAKRNLPVIDTAATVSDFPKTEDTAQTVQSGIKTAYVDARLNGWIVHSAVIVEDGKPTDLLDIRMPSFPEIRLGDLTKDERRAILDSASTRNIIENDNAIELVHKFFDEKIDVWRKLYGSVENALRIRGVPETFRKVS